MQFVSKTHALWCFKKAKIEEKSQITHQELQCAKWSTPKRRQKNISGTRFVRSWQIFPMSKFLSSEAGWSRIWVWKKLFWLEKEGRGDFFLPEVIAVILVNQVKGPIINTKEEAMKALGIDSRLVGELDYGVTIKVGSWINTITTAQAKKELLRLEHEQILRPPKI